MIITRAGQAYCSDHDQEFLVGEQCPGCFAEAGNGVRVGQIRQRRPGVCPEGSVPFRVMATDWLFADWWIVQDGAGRVMQKTTNEVLLCPEMPRG